MKARYLLLACALLLCTSCMESFKVKNQADKLALALNHYGADMRWGRYLEAYGYHVNRNGEKPEVDLDRLENFSVTSFTDTDTSVNAEASEATVTYEIKYYDEQYGTIRTLKGTHKWWYSEDAKAWLIESDFPDLK